MKRCAWVPEGDPLYAAYHDEEWGVPSRLATLAGFPGCHPGYVTDLATAWLAALDATQLPLGALESVEDVGAGVGVQGGHGQRRRGAG